MMVRLFFFFFSSTRRHTRFDCDWSSDVCSSDLLALARLAGHGPREVVDDEFEVRVLLQHRLHEGRATRSEEHTSELQSQSNLVCRLLLEKKKLKTLPPRNPSP